MYVYGDCHSDWDILEDLLGKQPDGPDAIQLGDYGIGFPSPQYFPYQNEEGLSFPITFPDTFKFIRGNHDHPALCRTHPNYLGDYGYLENSGIFYISGAFSIDKSWRTPGLTWWEGEELRYDELQDMITLFEKTKPRIVFSHTAPLFIIQTMLFDSLVADKIAIKSRTSIALQEAWERHHPAIWCFAHFHTSKSDEIDGTTFHCVNCVDSNERIVLDGVKF